MQGNECQMQLTDEQKKEIDQARLSNFETRRPTVSELEEIMFKPLPVLDRFVRIIDYMGDDLQLFKRQEFPIEGTARFQTTLGY